MEPSARRKKRPSKHVGEASGEKDPQSKQKDGASEVNEFAVPEPDDTEGEVHGKRKRKAKAVSENSQVDLEDIASTGTGASDPEPGETNKGKPPLWLRDSRRAIYRGEFVWQEKPNPYEGDLIGKGEEQDDCEQRIREELERAWQRASRKLIEENEVETANFKWRGHWIRWEKFLKIDWKKGSPFEDCGILTRLQEKKDRAVAKELRAPVQVRQMALAIHYRKLVRKNKAYHKTDKQGKRDVRKLVKPKANIGESDLALYSAEDDDEITHTWSELQDRYDIIMKSKQKSKVQKDDVVQSTADLLIKIDLNWTGWGKRNTADSVYENRRDRIAADNSKVLRPIPKDSIVVLVDSNEKLIALLIPEAIQDAFGPGVRDRMLTDTKHFYTHIKYANPGHNKRHVSEQTHSSRRYGPPGSDHYGIWHENGQTEEPIRESKDSSSCVPFVKQCLLHFLENTGGTMTKLLDFWFGVWEPELREQYRDIYRGLPKYARLPPTNQDRDEIYTLRVTVVNRDTDMHHDQNDWKRGLTGLVQLGDFKGGGMCLEELGVRLEGYGDGAMLLFRGTELHHYVAPWNWAEGGYRYAFDHTTHESVRQVVLNKKPYIEYIEPTFPEDDPNYDAEAELKKKDNASVDKNQAGKAKKAPAKKSSAKGAREKKAPSKKAMGKGKAKASTNSELEGSSASDAKLDDDDGVVDPRDKTTTPKKRPATDAYDDDNENPIPMIKPPGTARTNRALRKRPAPEISDDEDIESPKPTAKPAKRARTNKKDNAPEKLPTEPTRRSKRTRGT